MTATTRSGISPALRGWGRMAGVGAVVVALDQVTKAIVRGSLERGATVEVALGVEIVNVRNRGIAFGLLEDAGAILVVITVITLAALLAWFASNPARSGMWLAIGLLAGGAVGNLIDRLREQRVTDFLDLPAWPAFNVADVAITAGVLVLVALVLRDDRPDAGEGAAEA